MKNSKRLLLITFFLAALLSLSAYATQLPNANAAESTLQEKGASILSNVAALDLTKYTVTPRAYPQTMYFDVVPEENIGYTLKSNTSKLDILCTFANGKLHILHVLNKEGSPSTTKTASEALDMAKNFLNDYSAYSGNTLYAELSSTLNSVDASRNSTTTYGNLKLQVNATTNHISFSWTYTVNGVSGGNKCVALGFKKGFSAKSLSLLCLMII